MTRKFNNDTKGRTHKGYDLFFTRQNDDARDNFLANNAKYVKIQKILIFLLSSGKSYSMIDGMYDCIRLSNAGRARQKITG